eukprot:CAMPEP_0183433064 /NCGR_PEP_ID=MMETSP0370-20130417/61141_1 /TAXON_ID=268820 /ORGANISM="Peridinium aciculiferum, Strain PAER-2" /LENGTH=69 /DNA_ID=CAMNT_0025619289 /DNA_START=102 /DNA_END=312 /DNA_ORIENTATION=-
MISLKPEGVHSAGGGDAVIRSKPRNGLGQTRLPVLDQEQVRETNHHRFCTKCQKATRDANDNSEDGIHL